MAFIPHTPADVEAMLATIGVSSIEQLFDEIPASLRVKSLAGVPVGLNEMQVGRLMSERARTDSRDNRPQQTSMPTEAVRGARCLDQLWRNQHPNRQLAGARDAIDQPLDRPAADFIRPQVDRRRAWAQHRQP